MAGQSGHSAKALTNLVEIANKNRQYFGALPQARQVTEHNESSKVVHLR